MAKEYKVIEIDPKPMPNQGKELEKMLNDPSLLEWDLAGVVNGCHGSIIVIFQKDKLYFRDD